MGAFRKQCEAQQGSGDAERRNQVEGIKSRVKHRISSTKQLELVEALQNESEELIVLTHPVSPISSERKSFSPSISLPLPSLLFQKSSHRSASVALPSVLSNLSSSNSSNSVSTSERDERPKMV